MMPTTPSGTRMRPTWMPVGRKRRSVISPTGSGSAAICARPSAIAAIVFGVEREAVDERRVVARGTRGGDVLRIGGEERRFVAADRSRHGQQRGVLGARIGARELRCRGARGDTDRAHVCRDVGGFAQSGNVEVGHRIILARLIAAATSCCRRVPSFPRRREPSVVCPIDHVAGCRLRGNDGVLQRDSFSLASSASARPCRCRAGSRRRRGARTARR